MIRSKLVRDRIPELVGVNGHVSGHSVSFKQITGEELKEELQRKLQEEAAEFLLNPSSEELADILECVESLRKFYPDFESVKEIKALKKGQFEEGWFMTVDKK